MTLIMFAVIMLEITSSTLTSAQSATKLEEYVQEGLRNSLSLKQERLNVQSAEAATREAFGTMLPSVSVDTRYSNLGGNVQDLGALVNPVYATLNQLTGSNQFPTDLRLTLPAKQQTGLRLTQPLFAPQAYFGYRIRRDLESAERAGLAAKARDLVTDIKITYLNYAKAVRVVEIYEQTLALLAENLRVTQKLADNQQVTLDVVYRAKAELSDVEQKEAEAVRQRDAAVRYFNLLLDRPLDATIELDPDSVIAAVTLPSADSAMNCGMRHRDELSQVSYGIRAAENTADVHESAYLPTVGFAVDYGVQKDNYRFNRHDASTMVSVVARWNIFNGGQDDARRQQAKLATKRLSLQKNELEKQIRLQISLAYDAAIVARQALVTAQDRLQSAKRSFDLVSRRFAEGMASQLEYLDARTSYTSSSLNQTITTYDFVEKYVELERAAALISENVAKEL